jgi:hypothetical protein
MKRTHLTTISQYDLPREYLRQVVVVKRMEMEINVKFSAEQRRLVQALQ